MNWKQWTGGVYNRNKIDGGYTSANNLYSVYKRDSGQWSVWQREPTVMIKSGFRDEKDAMAWAALHITQNYKLREPFYMRKRWAHMMFNMRHQKDAAI